MFCIGLMFSGQVEVVFRGRCEGMEYVCKVKEGIM